MKANVLLINPTSDAYKKVDHRVNIVMGHVSSSADPLSIRDLMAHVDGFSGLFDSISGKDINILAQEKHLRRSEVKRLDGLYMQDSDDNVESSESDEGSSQLHNAANNGPPVVTRVFVRVDCVDVTLFTPSPSLLNLEGTVKHVMPLSKIPVKFRQAYTTRDVALARILLESFGFEVCFILLMLVFINATSYP